MSIDLDAIEALTADPYLYAQVSPEVTRGYLAALLADLRATTADLAVAVEVARERGKEAERLRDVAEAAERLLDRTSPIKDGFRGDMLHALELLIAALDAWRAGGGA